jgi:hypothetical protein
MLRRWRQLEGFSHCVSPLALLNQLRVEWYDSASSFNVEWRREASDMRRALATKEWRIV